MYFLVVYIPKNPKRIQIGPFKMKLLTVAFVVAVAITNSKAIRYAPPNINRFDASYEELPRQPPIYLSCSNGIYQL
ncbi:unnamed protein product [Tenebrio molitor]|nr:unnamed protein product [Tenebrio molitor]